MLSNSQALVKMREAGSGKVRMMPANAVGDGQLYQVEILNEDKWEPVTSSMTMEAASDLMKQANNRTICG
jgi:hypothetical protein